MKGWPYIRERLMAKYSKEKRVNRIVEMMEKNTSVTINELADYFSVSHMTIRRDIDELQSQGVVKVVFGGQVVKNFISASPEYKNKAQANVDWKKNIAMQAYKLIQPGQIIFMDGGTTVKQLAYLIDIPVTVITNDINTAYILNENEKIKVIICPGELIRESRSAYSSETLRYLSDHYTDIAFIGADGFSTEYGAMTTTQTKADCKWMAAAKTASSVLLVDHSKENLFCNYKIADLDYFNHVISDNE